MLVVIYYKTNFELYLPKFDPKLELSNQTKSKHAQGRRLSAENVQGSFVIRYQPETRMHIQKIRKLLLN